MEWQEVLRRYPEISGEIDPAEDLTNSAELVEADGKEFLLVTQSGEFEGGQHLFELGEAGLRLEYADNVVWAAQSGRSSFDAEAFRDGSCGASSGEDQTKVHRAAEEQVDRFSSRTGPDGGNLACVWAVRHIVKNTLGRWITRTDGTAVFGPELKNCFGGTLRERDVPAGGIVISPTEGRRVGHVGILGPSTGDGGRLIYSNSSSAAMWKQNFTLDRWVARYKTSKRLEVLFFPLPDPR